MQKNIVVTILSVVLLVLVLATIGFGCSFKLENFEDIEADVKAEKAPKTAEKEPAKEEAVELTPKEKEMFENIKNGTLSDEDIQKFIAEGKLTEKMVEKFLQHIDAPEFPVVGADAKDSKPIAPAKKAPVVEEDFDVEGFSGSMYAQF